MDHNKNGIVAIEFFRKKNENKRKRIADSAKFTHENLNVPKFFSSSLSHDGGVWLFVCVLHIFHAFFPHPPQFNVKLLYAHTQTYPDEMDIEYLPITSTLTKIRVHNKNLQPHIQNEILCYPIMNVTKPIDLFAPFPKQSNESANRSNPPSPPARVSSKDKVTALKAAKNGRIEMVPVQKRTTVAAASNDGSTRSKNRHTSAVRSRSASCLTTSFASLKDEKNFANNSRVAEQYVERVSSLSPIGRKLDKRKVNDVPIAFGRSISKERTFAEEKRKQEEQLPLCRRAWTASTNILRDPFVQSSNEVRDAVRNTYQVPQTRERMTTTTITKKNSAGNTVKTSAITYTKDKLSKDSVKNDEETVRMTTVELKPSDAPSVIVKSNLTKSSVKTETKMSPRSKQTTKMSSNFSLARTNSSYSIESSAMRRKIRNRPYSIKSTAKVTTIPPVTILSKSRKKKTDDKKFDQSQVTSIASDKTVKTVQPSSDEHERSNSFIMMKSGNDKSKSAIKSANLLGSRSDTFFQSLFLRNGPNSVGRTAHPKAEALHQNSLVQEKAQFYDTIPRRSNIKKRSPSVYLQQKQAVSGSKFLTLQNERMRQSRSLSPLRSPLKTINFNPYQKIDSFFQLSDEEEDEFGCTSFNYNFHERSRSEPRSITYIQREHASGQTTVKTNGHGEQTSRSLSPTREVRSPSSRRIHSFRAQHKIDTHNSSGHRRYHSLDSRIIRRSARSPNADGSDVVLASQPEKFKDLNRFYSTVERVGQLERATSNTDLHPIRRENELIDFDVWKRVRDYEKAARELSSLVGKLKSDEREKDFLFRPKYPEDIKWDRYNESGLRVRDKSVEDLKEIFIEKMSREQMDDHRLANDRYRSLWKGSSVVDLATNVAVRLGTSEESRRMGLSSNLISTLSKDQVSKIKNQLTEIYSTSSKGTKNKTETPPARYVIDVNETNKIRPTNLLVRSNSLLGEKDLLKPVLQRQESRWKNTGHKAESMTTVQETRITRSVDRYDSMARRQAQPVTEDVRRKLLQQLGNEICDKIKERREKIVHPKETRGAQTVEGTTKARSIHSGDQPRKSNSSDGLSSIAKMSIDTTKSSANNSTTPVIDKHDSHKDMQQRAKSSSLLAAIEPINEKVKQKIDYFEMKKDEKQPKTIYLPRDDSSIDDDEVIRMVEAKYNERHESEKPSSLARDQCYANGLSSSTSDFKEIFGERESARNLMDFRTPTPTNTTDNHSKVGSDAVEMFFRSRSISPINNSVHSTLKRLPADELLTSSYGSKTTKQIPNKSRSIFALPPRRFKSDPAINEITFRNPNPSKIIVKSHEAGDVSFITHKFELKKEAANRGRARTRRVPSPTFSRVSLRKGDRLMPHIDIISKTIALKEAINRSIPPRTNTKNLDVIAGEVKSLCHKFESQTSDDRVSLIGQMYTSSPDISELKDISNYLSSTWIAHKYSKPNDNARSAVDPEKGPTNQEIKRKLSARSNSTSPTPNPQNIRNMLKPLYDIFADQNYDPLKHRPSHRYVPVDKRIEAEYLWRRLRQQSNTNKSAVKVAVKSKG